MQGNLTVPPSQSHQSSNPQSENRSELTSTEKISHSIFGNLDKNLLLFAYNKHHDENSPQQIMVLQQPKKKIKCENQEESVNEMLSKICFQPQTQQKLFLKKVDPFERKEIAEEIKSMMSLANRLSTEDRFQRRREIFESSKARKGFNYASEQVISKRTIKVVKIDSLIQGGSVRGVVQLGGKSVQYEDLSFQQNDQEFYTLVKKTVRSDEIYPEIQLQREQLFGEISYEVDEVEKEYDLYGDEYDSNDSDNPNYDYPDEDESGRSSEGIIERDYDQDEEMYNEEYQEDEEKLYQRYLRRLRKKQKQMQIEPEYQDFE